jgi:hypothetical protein
MNNYYLQTKKYNLFDNAFLNFHAILDLSSQKVLTKQVV